MESALRDRDPEGDGADQLKVIETFRYEAGPGFLRLPQHLARCAETCAKLGAPFDAAKIRRTLNALAPPPIARIRLIVDMEGRIEIAATPLEDEPKVWRLTVCAERLDPEDRWLRMKTTRRALYDKARAQLPDGVDEALFANSRDRLCEGTITNLFVDFGEGMVTPPVADGLLPGVLRQQMLDAGQAREESIPLNKLPEAQSVLVGNSLRGLIPATLAG